MNNIINANLLKLDTWNKAFPKVAFGNFFYPQNVNRNFREGYVI